jgi:5-methylcytosine-specific restriction protein A
MIRRESPSAARQGDDRAWQQTRAEFLSCHPRCEMNDAKAISTHRIYGDVATDVDQVVPKAAGGGDDGGNLRALCHRCHSRQTRQRQLAEKG